MLSSSVSSISRTGYHTISTCDKMKGFRCRQLGVDPPVESRRNCSSITVAVRFLLVIMKGFRCRRLGVDPPLKVGETVLLLAVSFLLVIMKGFRCRQLGVDPPVESRRNCSSISRTI